MPVRIRVMFATLFGVAAFVSGPQQTVRADVPPRMTVQGKLTNPGGSPQTGTFTFTFKIYDAAAGGTDIWPAGAGESQVVTTDADGLWTAQLGMTTALTDPVFSSTERWLEITVSGGGGPTETLSRVKLNTNPFAYRISTVDGSTGGVISGDLAIAGGNLELDHPSTATTGVITKGGVPFIHNFGGENTFLGLGAGNLTMGGFGNVGSGVGALATNINGDYNTASGWNALTSNTSGSRNTASGRMALANNSIGGYNTAVGFNALNGNTESFYNTACGASALFNNTTGSGNTATGWDALSNNTVGTQNTAVGISTLMDNTTGSNNTASGCEALLRNTTGSNNTASGHSALHSNTTGDFNTASGRNTLYSSTSGYQNTASGLNALFFNTAGVQNTGAGSSALYSNTTGSNNTASGMRALLSNITGSNNTALGFGADVSDSNLDNATALGSGAVVNASNKIRLGDGAVAVIEGQVAYTFTSDKNEKENFQPVDGDEVLRKLRGLNLASWNYIGHDPQQFRHYGPVAQEFFAAFGHDDVGTSGTPTTINSGDMAGILMIAVQALEKRTEENADLKARIEALERLVQSGVTAGHVSGN